MFELMKMVGASAVLSAGFVTASEMPPSQAAGSAGAKLYTERLAEDLPAQPTRIVLAGTGEIQSEQPVRTAKGDSLGAAPSDCAARGWPNIPRECLAAAAGTPVRTGVRTITIERREGPNTSVLVRMPAPAMAQR